LLGFDVDVVNSVHFSNHTGYKEGWEGDVLKGDQLRAILDGLQRNDLLGEIGHVLTGYIGSESFLEAVLDVIQTLRGAGGCLSSSGTTTSAVRFVCDPVLGDKGEFYVPTSLVALYRDRVLPLADVVTPNQVCVVLAVCVVLLLALQASVYIHPSTLLFVGSAERVSHFIHTTSHLMDDDDDDDDDA